MFHRVWPVDIVQDLLTLYSHSHTYRFFGQQMTGKYKHVNCAMSSKLRMPAITRHALGRSLSQVGWGPEPNKQALTAMESCLLINNQQTNKQNHNKETIRDSNREDYCSFSYNSSILLEPYY